MQAEKEYGKLTAQQFKGLIGALPELKRQGEGLRQLLAEVPTEQLDSLIGKDFHWAGAYELSFHHHLCLVAHGFNLAEYVKSLALAPDPQALMLQELWERELPEDHPVNFEKGLLIGLVFSLQRTILSVMLYQVSMSGLVQLVRESGDTEALFKAVRVDRAAVATPSIARFIARAELRHDETFFRHLRAALKGPSKKHWEAYTDLRYALFALREMGLDKLSDAQLEHLLVDTLKVYSPTPSARRNLRAQYQQSRKLKTI